MKYLGVRWRLVVWSSAADYNSDFPLEVLFLTAFHHTFQGAKQHYSILSFYTPFRIRLQLKEDSAFCRIVYLQVVKSGGEAGYWANWPNMHVSWISHGVRRFSRLNVLLNLLRSLINEGRCDSWIRQSMQNPPFGPDQRLFLHFLALEKTAALHLLYRLLMLTCFQRPNVNPRTFVL